MGEFAIMRDRRLRRLRGEPVGNRAGINQVQRAFQLCVVVQSQHPAGLQIRRGFQRAKRAAGGELDQRAKVGEFQLAQGLFRAVAVIDMPQFKAVLRSPNQDLSNRQLVSDLRCEGAQGRMVESRHGCRFAPSNRHSESCFR